MTPEEAADLVAACEAEGVTLAPSATPGRIRTLWPNSEVADRLRPEVIRNRTVVLQVLTDWPRCVRCLHRCRRVVPTYWGEELCSPCVAFRVAEFEEADRWPATPWPARTLPEWRWPPRRPPRTHPPPPEARYRPGPPAPGPLRPDGSETCPACRPHRWNRGRLCPRHSTAYRRGHEAAPPPPNEEATP